MAARTGGRGCGREWVHVCLSYQDAGGAVGQWAVRYVGVTSNPTDVGRAPVDVVRLVVENQFKGGGGVEHVAAHRVEHPLQAVRDEQFYSHRHTNRKSQSLPLVVRGSSAALQFKKVMASL